MTVKIDPEPFLKPLLTKASEQLSRRHFNQEYRLVFYVYLLPFGRLVVRRIFGKELKIAQGIRDLSCDIFIRIGLVL